MKTAFLKTDVAIYKIVGNHSGIIQITSTEVIEHYDIPNELKQAHQELKEYFEGTREVFNFDLLLNGTEFQKKVWIALMNIPYGETRTYKDIAIEVGSPKAYRAVGMANNKNKIAIGIPCHRVIGSNKKLIGYAGGLHLKEYLIELEKRRA
ncbi:methylated-DNA--[protein]-cysteine S-methyltransferase [Mycoplasmatota bacterium WC44]